jgi:hypothetical protein
MMAWRKAGSCVMGNSQFAGRRQQHRH